jgi:hypothetical protein
MVTRGDDGGCCGNEVAGGQPQDYAKFGGDSANDDDSFRDCFMSLVFSGAADLCTAS